MKNRWLKNKINELQVRQRCTKTWGQRSKEVMHMQQVRQANIPTITVTKDLTRKEKDEMKE